MRVSCVRPWVLLLVLLSACEGEDPPLEPEPTDAFLRARIDGTPWQSDPAALDHAALRGSPGIYLITGVQSASTYGIVIQLFHVPGPGSYTLGMGPEMIGGAGHVTRGTQAWSTPLDGASGTLTVTELTDTRISGTFTFTASALGGSSTVGVTDGEFDLPIVPLGPGGPPPENAGSVFTGTMNGVHFNASSGSVALGGGQNPLLTIAASTLDRGLTISVGRMTGPGTYELSATNPVRAIQVGIIDGSAFHTWSSLPNGSGSVTVTSVTSRRIRGTFTAELAPSSAGAIGTMSVSGTFDMGRR